MWEPGHCTYYLIYLYTSVDLHVKHNIPLCVALIFGEMCTNPIDGLVAPVLSLHTVPGSEIKPCTVALLLRRRARPSKAKMEERQKELRKLKHDEIKARRPLGQERWPSLALAVCEMAHGREERLDAVCCQVLWPRQ